MNKMVKITCNFEKIAIKYNLYLKATEDCKYLRFQKENKERSGLL